MSTSIVTVAAELVAHETLGGPPGPFICARCGGPLFGEPTGGWQHESYRGHCFDYFCRRCGPCACDQLANRFYPAAYGHSGWCFCPVGTPCRFCDAEQ